MLRIHKRVHGELSPEKCSVELYSTWQRWSEQRLVTPFHDCQWYRADDVVTFEDVAVGTGDSNAIVGVPLHVLHELLELDPVLRQLRAQVTDECRVTRWEFHVGSFRSLVGAEFCIGDLLHGLTATFACFLIESVRSETRRARFRRILFVFLPSLQ